MGPREDLTNQSKHGVRFADVQYAFAEDTVKVTISLSRESVDFFKAEAKKNNTQYQRMIRRLLDAYARTYRGPVSKQSSRRAKGRD